MWASSSLWTKAASAPDPKLTTAVNGPSLIEIASSSTGSSGYGPAVIASGYTLRIPDNEGKIHLIPVTLQTILALHEKLEEFV